MDLTKLINQLLDITLLGNYTISNTFLPLALAPMKNNHFAIYSIALFLLLLVGDSPVNAQQMVNPYAVPAYGQPMAVPVAYQQPAVMPAYQQPAVMPAYQQPAVMPAYQQPAVMPAYQQPMAYNQQPMQNFQQAMPMQTQQAYQPGVPTQPIAKSNGFNSKTSSTLSPYEQQELALKEAKMLQELENMKQSRDNSESFRKYDNSSASNSDFEKGFVSKSSNSRFGRTLRGVGSVMKSGAKTFGPAATSIGASVGSFFIIRSAYR